MFGRLRHGRSCSEVATTFGGKCKGSILKTTGKCIAGRRKSMALFAVGNDRYCKLFPANSTFKRVLIKDISCKGILTDAFIQGAVAKVYPVQIYKRGKHCKIVLKEDEEEGRTCKSSSCAIINVFFYGDLAEEGYNITENDVVVLSEVIVELSPTSEHQFQLIANRKKSRVLLWVISNSGGKRKVRENKGGEYPPVAASKGEEVVTDRERGSANRDEDSSTCNSNFETDDSIDESSDEEATIKPSTAKSVLQQASEALGRSRITPTIKKRKFCLGPRGVTPSVSHVQGLRNMVVLINNAGLRKPDEPSRSRQDILLTAGSPSKKNSANVTARKSFVCGKDGAVAESNCASKESAVIRSGKTILVAQKSLVKDRDDKNSSSGTTSHLSPTSEETSGRSTHVEVRSPRGPISDRLHKTFTSDETSGRSTHVEVGSPRRYVSGRLLRSILFEESSGQSTDDETRSPRTRRQASRKSPKFSTVQEPSGQSTDDDSTRSPRTRRHASRKSPKFSTVQEPSGQSTDDDSTRSPRTRRHVSRKSPRIPTVQEPHCQSTDDETRSLRTSRHAKLRSPKIPTVQEPSGQSTDDETQSVDCRRHTTPTVQELSGQSTDVKTRNQLTRTSTFQELSGHSTDDETIERISHRTPAVQESSSESSSCSQDTDARTSNPSTKQHMSLRSQSRTTSPGIKQSMILRIQSCMTSPETKQRMGLRSQSCITSPRTNQYMSLRSQRNLTIPGTKQCTIPRSEESCASPGTEQSCTPQKSACQVTNSLQRSPPPRNLPDENEDEDVEKISSSTHTTPVPHASPAREVAVHLTKPNGQMLGCHSTAALSEKELSAPPQSDQPDQLAGSVKEPSEAAVTPDLVNVAASELGEGERTPSGAFSPLTRKRSLSPSLVNRGQEESSEWISDDGEAPSHVRFLLPPSHMTIDQVSSTNILSLPQNEGSCSPAKRSCRNRERTREANTLGPVDTTASGQGNQDASSPLVHTRGLIPQDYTTFAVPSSSSNIDSDTGAKQFSTHSGDEEGSTSRQRSTLVSTCQPDPSLQAQSTTSDGNQSDTSNTSNGMPSRATTTVYTVPPGYTKLADLQQNTTVNVYGVVKLFKPAWKCRGTDMCSVVYLTDPSVSETSTEGLECIMFQENASRLPQVHNVGDIVRLHRVKLAQYQGRLQAKSSRGFAAIVFDRDVDLPVSEQAARVSSSTFTLTESDKQTFAKLTHWCDANPDLFPSPFYLSVASISPDSNFNFVCQVKAVALHRTMDCVALFVTDGTQPQYEMRKCDSGDYSMSVPLSSAAEEDDDTTVCVFLYGLHAQVAKLLVRKPGMFLILHDVHSQFLKGCTKSSVLNAIEPVVDAMEPVLELCIHRESVYGRGLTVLSPESEKVKPIVERLCVTHND